METQSNVEWLTWHDFYHPEADHDHDVEDPEEDDDFDMSGFCLCHDEGVCPDDGYIDYVDEPQW